MIVKSSLLVFKKVENQQSSIWYTGLLAWLDDCLINQGSDGPSIIFFHNFLQNPLQKSFQFIVIFL